MYGVTKNSRFSNHCWPLHCAKSISIPTSVQHDLFQTRATWTSAQGWEFGPRRESDCNARTGSHWCDRRSQKVHLMLAIFSLLGLETLTLRRFIWTFTSHPSLDLPVNPWRRLPKTCHPKSQRDFGRFWVRDCSIRIEARSYSKGSTRTRLPFHFSALNGGCHIRPIRQCFNS